MSCPRKCRRRLSLAFDWLPAHKVNQYRINHPWLLEFVFLCCVRCARVIAPPLCRSASLGRRSVSGRTRDYTVRNTRWPESCTAHPTEKRPGRIPRAEPFFLCLEFLERCCDPRDSTLLTLLRRHRAEGCPPLFNILGFAVRTDNPALLIL